MQSRQEFDADLATKPWIPFGCQKRSLALTQLGLQEGFPKPASFKRRTETEQPVVLARGFDPRRPLREDFVCYNGFSELVVARNILSSALRFAAQAQELHAPVRAIWRILDARPAGARR
jgi:hypothetical protein